MGKYNSNNEGNAGNHKGFPPQLPRQNSRQLPQRKSIRLKGYDYSQAGLYFITMVTQNRKCLFGDIKNGKTILNNAGKMIENEWFKLTERFKNIKLHEYIIMPNHFHGILQIGATLVVAPFVNAQNDKIVKLGDGGQCGQPQGIAPTNAPTIDKTIIQTDKTIGDMIGAFKSNTTNEYIKMVKQNILPPFNKRIWQRNYWEHIIRNENEYNRITQYIINNPIKWENDKLNGENGNVVMEPSAEYNSEIWMI